LRARPGIEICKRRKRKRVSEERIQLKGSRIKEFIGQAKSDGREEYTKSEK